jgi:CheY-like chemotaxis protein
MAYDGRDGYEKYISYQPQLIITDIEIPQISGLELCKIIKLDINDRKTPVILYTSSTKMENVEKAFEYRANAYVTKNQRPERANRKTPIRKGR